MFSDERTMLELLLRNLSSGTSVKALHTDGRGICPFNKALIAFLRTNLSLHPSYIYTCLKNWIPLPSCPPPFMPYRPSTIAQPRIKYIYIFITSASTQVQCHEFISCAIPIQQLFFYGVALYHYDHSVLQYATEYHCSCL